MRWLSVRLIVSLIVGITLVSVAFSYNEVRLEKLALRRDLERRAEVLAESLAGYIEPYLERQSHRELQRIVDRFGHRERLEGMAIYSEEGDRAGGDTRSAGSPGQASASRGSSDCRKSGFGAIHRSGRLPFISTLILCENMTTQPEVC